MRYKYILITSLLALILSFFIQEKAIAEPANPFPIEYKQPASNLRTGIYLLSVKDIGAVQGFKLLLQE